MIPSQAKISLRFTVNMAAQREEGNLLAITLNGGRVQGYTYGLLFHIQSITSDGLIRR